jgi:hypothetical protein
VALIIAQIRRKLKVEFVFVYVAMQRSEARDSAGVHTFKVVWLHRQGIRCGGRSRYCRNLTGLNNPTSAHFGGNRMRIVHFTEVATDPIEGFCAHGVRYVPLVDGAGTNETYLSCLHFEPAGWIYDPPIVRDSTLLIVHGAVTLIAKSTGMRLNLTPGMGIVIGADDQYKLESDFGAIVLSVEAERLEATVRGLSEPERILEARWPGEGEAPRRRTNSGLKPSANPADRAPRQSTRL